MLWPDHIRTRDVIKIRVDYDVHNKYLLLPFYIAFYIICNVTSLERFIERTSIKYLWRHQILVTSSNVLGARRLCHLSRSASHHFASHAGRGQRSGASPGRPQRPWPFRTAKIQRWNWHIVTKSGILKRIKCDLYTVIYSPRNHLKQILNKKIHIYLMNVYK